MLNPRVSKYLIILILALSTAIRYALAPTLFLEYISIPRVSKYFKTFILFSE